MAYENAVRQSLYALAIECRHPGHPLPGDRALERLREIFDEYKWDFSRYEGPLLEIQREYNECIQVLRRLPEKDRKQIHTAIKAQREFQRVSAYTDYLRKQTRALEQEEREGKSGGLRQRISATSENMNQVRNAGALAKEEIVCLSAGGFSSYARIAQLVRKREALKIEFFLHYAPDFLIESNTQNAFDVAIRSAAQAPSWWDWISCCSKRR